MHTMEFSSPENFSVRRKMAIQPLIHGLDFAQQLRSILEKRSGDDGSRLAATEDLVLKIIGSFTESLSILNSSVTEEVSQIPATPLFWDGRKSEDSDESSKTSAVKDRRGCYKRRKTSQTWTKDTPTLMDDGHAWRKYGQKTILNAKYPRNYYRCTHKYDQGCQATKQVQRTQDDPAMYRTTYHGLHTCKDLLKAPQIILDSTLDRKDSSYILSFNSVNPVINKSNDPFFPTFSLMKQEDQDKEEKPKFKQNKPTSSDYLLSPDLTTLSDHADVISSGVYSCTASTHSHSLDMDMMVEGVDLDDVLQFDY